MPPEADNRAAMEALLIVKDPLVRDQVKVGITQFPEFAVTVGTGYEGLNELRLKTFDCVFLGVDPRDKETMRWLQHMRSFDKTTELIVLTGGHQMKELSAEKSRYDIHSFLQTPLAVKEFFAFVGRFLERRASKQPGPVARKGVRNRAMPAKT
jgi:DNA-binding NtrC family response regulator